jgi:hypothetical protein
MLDGKDLMDGVLCGLEVMVSFGLRLLHRFHILFRMMGLLGDF